MKRVDAVIYDAEIVKCVPNRGEERESDLEYCLGWNDKRGMGVAVVCAIDLRTAQPRIFCEDNLHDFAELVSRRSYLIGFNSKLFDDPLLAAAGWPVTTTYDLKEEVFAALGERLKSYRGARTLDKLAESNLGVRKSESAGAMAPKNWQRGKRGAVIDACMQDVFLTARLIAKLPHLVDPVTGQTLTVRPCEADPAQEALL